MTVTSLTPTLYAHRGAGNAVVLTWDRAGLKHAMTVFDHRTVGRTITANDGWEDKLCIICWASFQDQRGAA